MNEWACGTSLSAKAFKSLTPAELARIEELLYLSLLNAGCAADTMRLTDWRGPYESQDKETGEVYHYYTRAAYGDKHVASA